MSATLHQIYLWALSEQDRLDSWERFHRSHGKTLSERQRQVRDCAAGAVRLLDAVLSDTVILDRLKAAAASRAKAAKAAAAAAAAETVPA